MLIAAREGYAREEYKDYTMEGTVDYEWMYGLSREAVYDEGLFMETLQAVLLGIKSRL